ncbi:GNAT family N-acetyltransferase [Streptomyces mobaraensis]|nr:GNAT family N-acetyltransferase [Streptomyces mobaraensis]
MFMTPIVGGLSMPVEQVVTRYPELAWELRTSDGVVGHAEALDGETAWLCRINVQPNYRGHGYASRLLHTVLAHFPDVIVGLAASPLPFAEPGLGRGELHAWYGRHGFVSAPLAGDPHRMIRMPSPSHPGEVTSS